MAPPPPPAPPAPPAPPTPPSTTRALGDLRVETRVAPRNGWVWPSVRIARNPWSVEFGCPQEFKTIALRVHGDELLGARTELVRWAAVAPAVHLARSRWFAGSFRRLPPRPWLALPWTAALCTTFRTQVTVNGTQRTASLGGPFSPAWSAPKNPANPE